MSKRPSVFVHLALLLMAALWGGTFVAIKYLLNEVTPLALIGIRFWISAIIFLGFLAITRRPESRMPRRDLLRLIGASATGIVAYQLALNFGERKVGAGTSALIVAVHPIVTAIAATFLLSERFSSRKAAGFAIAILGLVLVVTLGSHHADFRGELPAMLLVLVAPISWSASTLLTKPLSGRYPAAWLTSWIMIIGAGLMTPAAGLGALRQIANLTPCGWLAMVFLSVGATFLAYLLWYYGLEHLEAGKISIYIYLSPFFALMGGALLLGEIPTLYAGLGGAMILGGVALTNSH